MLISLNVKYPLFLSDFNELEFSREIFEKYSNIKFHEFPVGAESFRADTRTGWVDEANCRSSQFCEGA